MTGCVRRPSRAVFTTAGTVALVLAIARDRRWRGRCTGGGRCPSPPRPGALTVAARKELYGNTVNESLLMRPGQWLTRLSVYFDNRGVDGLVNTIAADRGRHVGTGPAGADRVRPVLRPVHVRGRGAADRRPPAGADLGRRQTL